MRDSNVRLCCWFEIATFCLFNAANLSSEIRAHNCQIEPTAPKAGTHSDWWLLMAYWLLTHIHVRLQEIPHTILSCLILPLVGIARLGVAQQATRTRTDASRYANGGRYTEIGGCGKAVSATKVCCFLRRGCFLLYCLETWLSKQT